MRSYRAERLSLAYRVFVTISQQSPRVGVVAVAVIGGTKGDPDSAVGRQIATWRTNRVGR